MTSKCVHVHTYDINMIISKHTMFVVVVAIHAMSSGISVVMISVLV